MRSLPLVVCCLLFAVFARAETTDSIEVMFLQLGARSIGFLKDGEILKKELIGGQADFSDLTQLPKSEYYVGYRLMAKLKTVKEFAGESLSLTLWMVDFEGFVELEEGKFTPMITQGSKNYLLNRFNRNRGWVAFPLPAAIVVPPSFDSFEMQLSVGEEGENGRFERVDVAAEQRGGVLFVRWTGPVEEGSGQKKFEDYYNPGQVITSTRYDTSPRRPRLLRVNPPTRSTEPAQAIIDSSNDTSAVSGENAAAVNRQNVE